MKGLIRAIRYAVLVVADESDALWHRLTGRCTPWTEWVDEQICGPTLAEMVECGELKRIEEP